MTNDTDMMFRAEGLSVSYGRKEVVHGLDLHVDAGEILVVLGHNGAGKTTAMKAIFGIDPPTSGKITLAGRDISRSTPVSNVLNGFAYVPQGHRVFKSLNVQANLELGAFAQSENRASTDKMSSVFELFPILKERRKQVAGTLSGGQQQMLAIGMALMNNPQFLILDEPSIGLAPNLVDRVMQAICTINETLGVTVLMVEQNVNAGLSLADRVAIMKAGKKIYDGEVAPMRDHVTLMEYF